MPRAGFRHLRDDAVCGLDHHHVRYSARGRQDQLAGAEIKAEGHHEASSGTVQSSDQEEGAANDGVRGAEVYD